MAKARKSEIWIVKARMAMSPGKAQAMVMSLLVHVAVISIPAKTMSLNAIHIPMVQTTGLKMPFWLWRNIKQEIDESKDRMKYP